MKVKAISVKEPWAGMIRRGEKTIETRTWKTTHRGWLLICASKTPRTALSGKAVAVAKLVDCRPMTYADLPAACCDLYYGAQAWILEDVKAIEPFPVSGQLSLYDVEIPPGGLRLLEPSPLTPSLQPGAAEGSEA